MMRINTLSHIQNKIEENMSSIMKKKKEKNHNSPHLTNLSRVIR